MPRTIQTTNVISIRKHETTREVWVMRVLVLPSYSRQGASSRLRMYQFEEALRSRGICCDFEPLLSDHYLTARYTNPLKAKLGALRAIVSRIRVVFGSGGYDVVWLQREAIPWLPAFLELWLKMRSIPFIVDYDDAVFHQYDKHRSALVRVLLGKKIDRIMKRATAVVVGNNYLHDRAGFAGVEHIVDIPTVVDTRRYSARAEKTQDVLTIGWIGTPVTAKFLRLIEEPLRRAATQTSMRLVTIGSGAYSIDGVDVENLEWHEDTEVSDIQKFDIGIMPLEDAFWERGKCGYKIIQYMACAVPAIASPVGANAHIVTHAGDGWLASTVDEWERFFLRAAEERQLLVAMGARGKLKVEQSYSIDGVIDKLAGVIRYAGNESSVAK